MTIASLVTFRYPVAMIGSLIFAIFDAGDLVCCLPRLHRAAALELPGATLWAPLGGPEVFTRWVCLPESVGLAIWQHYGLVAMRYAMNWLERDAAWREQNS